MTWADEDSGRKAELPANWDSEIRPRILKRDGHRCRWRLPSKARCPRPATDVDHVGDKHDHSDRNLRALCGHHHAQRTAKQGHAARRQKYAKKLRAPEPDPGALG